VQNDFSNTICQQEPIKTIIFSQGGKASAPSGLSACAVVAGFGYGQIEDPGWNLLRLEGLGRIEMVRFLMVVQSAALFRGPCPIHKAQREDTSINR
jgi:hypothetical protein